MNGESGRIGKVSDFQLQFQSGILDTVIRSGNCRVRYRLDCLTLDRNGKLTEDIIQLRSMQMI
jgi:hypothetical protein